MPRIGWLTAHYRFGARTGGATLVLGVLLIVLALGFGSSSATILALIPLPVLGALLSLVGIQHALLARDVRAPYALLIVAATAIIAFMSGNVAIGFGVGIALDQVGRLRERYSSRRSRLAPQLSTATEAPAVRPVR